MESLNIKLSTIEDVRKFVNIVAKYSMDIDLTSGRYVVDAKSIMGIFSLDLLKSIKLSAHGEDTKALFEELKEYIVE